MCYCRTGISFTHTWEFEIRNRRYGNPKGGGIVNPNREMGNAHMRNRQPTNMALVVMNWETTKNMNWAMRNDNMIMWQMIYDLLRFTNQGKHAGRHAGRYACMHAGRQAGRQAGRRVGRQARRHWLWAASNVQVPRNGLNGYCVFQNG